MGGKSVKVERGDAEAKKERNGGNTEVNAAGRIVSANCNRRPSCRQLPVATGKRCKKEGKRELQKWTVNKEGKVIYYPTKWYEYPALFRSSGLRVIGRWSFRELQPGILIDTFCFPYAWVERSGSRLPDKLDHFAVYVLPATRKDLSQAIIPNGFSPKQRLFASGLSDNHRGWRWNIFGSGRTTGTNCRRLPYGNRR